MKLKLGIPMFLLMLMVPSSSYAAACTVSSAGVAFGRYVPASGTNDRSTGTVTISCSGLLGLLLPYVPYTISLNSGLYSGGIFSNRRMFSGSSYLSYQLYSNSAGTTVWGDGTGGSSTVSGTCTAILGNCSSSKTIYGLIPALQSGVAPGTYSDTVTVTVSY